MASFQAAQSASALRMGPCGQVNEWPRQAQLREYRDRVPEADQLFLNAENEIVDGFRSGDRAGDLQLDQPLVGEP